MLNQFIGIFLPSLVGIKQCNNAFGESKGRINYMERYFLLVLFTNLFSYIITIWIFKAPNFEFTNQFTVKYVIMSLIISYLLPIVAKFIKYNFNINVVVKKNEK